MLKNKKLSYNRSIGIMQGRLTPSLGRGIQFFPCEEGAWEREFVLAAEIGISHIEWVLDTPENPLMNRDFRKRVHDCVMKTGIPIRGVDLQFLTKIDFATISDRMLRNICEAIIDIRGLAIEPPFLEGSSLLDTKMREARIARLARFSEIAKEYGLSLNLETDLPPVEYEKLLVEIPTLSVIYDSGNSASLGYDLTEEWNTYDQFIQNVQIKDRTRGGSTVPLGRGDTDFATLFKMMKERKYQGLLTLEAARGEDGKEKETIQQYMKFITDIYESV